MKVLYFCFIWPEPKSSAAGVRTLQSLLSLKDAGHDVVVVSSCQSNEYQAQLEDMGFQTKRFFPNDSTLDSFLKEYNPNVAFFDRFMIEEQFSWRVKEHCPEALRILDTIDMHSLRRTRQAKAKKGISNDTWQSEDYANEDFIREIAAIYRSDLTLVLSDFEYEFLVSSVGVSKELLALSRFFYPSLKAVPAYSDRAHFVSIGNFNHPPNVDSVKLLSSTIWPEIKRSLIGDDAQHAELHVYGAYPSHEILCLDSPKTGFRIKGWAEDACETLSHYKVNLAPLQFGAGIKGKVSDGWYAGTPCIGTWVAAEGMCEHLPFGGVVENDLKEFSKAAALVYQNRNPWEQHQQNGFAIIEALYNKEKICTHFLNVIEEAFAKKNESRSRNIVGALLWSSQMRSTEYLSRWIEAKNRSQKPAEPILENL